MIFERHANYRVLAFLFYSIQLKVKIKTYFAIFLLLIIKFLRHSVAKQQIIPHFLPQHLYFYIILIMQNCAKIGQYASFFVARIYL
jgi:hypothetical protein